MATYTLFKTKAPGIMADLIRDLGIDMLDAAAIVGNAGHECAGFEKLQEIKPTVKGSRGGYGWFQWTGPRRRAFEAYCKANSLDPAGDVANYAFLLHELKTSEKAALPALRVAKTLRAKVEAFEESFERAGVKAYVSRMRYAKMALNAANLMKKTKVAVIRDEVAVGDIAEKAFQPDKAEIERIQRRLRALGYFEVGEPDGRAGSRTFGALTSFQNDNNLPLTTDSFDRATIDVLMDLRTPHRPVSAERATATASDLKSVPAIAIGDKLVKAGGVIAITAGSGGLIDLTNNLDGITKKVQSAKGLYDAVLSFGPWAIGITTGLILVYVAGKLIRSQVEAYREGRHL